MAEFTELPAVYFWNLKNVSNRNNNESTHMDMWVCGAIFNKSDKVIIIINQDASVLNILG